MSTFEKIKEIIVDALYIDDPTVVTPSARLVGDLGAESIDFLDILFRIEKDFGVKVPKGEIERRAREGLSDAEFAVNGVLSAEGLERLKGLMPEIDPASFVSGLKLHSIPSLYTVQTFVSLVDNSLARANHESAKNVPPSLAAPALAN